LAWGGQAVVGAVLGLVWVLVAPRPEARWSGTFWVAEADYGFGAAQDVWFALLTALPGLVVGLALTWWSGRPRAGRRLVLWMVGAVAGAWCCVLVGAAAGGAFASRAVGAAVRAPVELTSWGLVATWAVLAAVVPAVGLAARAAFGRSW
jgi:hypothetical protein